MTKDVGILVLGLLVAAMPYLGFPAHIERIILVIIGLIIALLAFLLRGDFSLFSIERKADTFVEEGPGRRGALDEAVTRDTEEQYEQEHPQAGQ